MNHRPSISYCPDCLHYQPQASFVDAYKEFDRAPPREPLMKSLLDLRKEETRVQENEMELQLELLMTEQMSWPTRPRFAPLCVFGGGLWIPAAKNANGECKDYKEALNRQGRACRTCQFIVRPETKVGDRRQMPSGAGGTQEAGFYRQLNKEQDDADAMAQALEIEQSFNGDGCLPAAFFLPTCGVRVTEGRRNVAPFCNLRNDCADHRAHMPLPDALVKLVNKTATEADDGALAQTINIARLASLTDPAKFMSALSAWVGEDPAGRAGAAQWASSCGRWSPPRGGPSGPPAGAASAPLRPFIAGCDAYEWGLLGAFSRTSGEGARTAAAVLCQQVAEFLATVVSPLQAACCIGAVDALVEPEPKGSENSKPVFSPMTRDLIDGFVKRLRGHAEELRLVAKTDLQRYYEEFAGLQSYKVGTWLALAWRDPAYLARFDSVDAELGEKLRLQDRTKLAEARTEGTELLENIAALANGILSADRRTEILNRLLGSNESSLDRDQTDATDLINEGIDRGAKKWGLPLDLPVSPGESIPTYRALFTNVIRQAFGIQYDVPRATVTPRRRVFASLFWRRGLDPVTPFALEILGRSPQPGRLPESIEQVVTEPAQTTLEALHKAMFGIPETARGYLISGRRVGAPCFLPAH